MPKLKTHKALMKRVKITARGKVKFKRTRASHLNSHMSGKKICQLRRKRLVTAADIRRVRAILHLRLRAGTPARPSCR